MPRIPPKKKARRKRTGPPMTSAGAMAELLAGADDPKLDPLVRQWLRKFRDHGTGGDVPMPPTPTQQTAPCPAASPTPSTTTPWLPEDYLQEVETVRGETGEDVAGVMLRHSKNNVASEARLIRLCDRAAELQRGPS